MNRLSALRALPLLAALLASAIPCSAQKSPAEPAAAKGPATAAPDTEAQQLVQEILARTPAKPLAFEGVLKRRDADGRRTQIPIRYSIQPTPDGWIAIYESRPTPQAGGERLEITHLQGRPNDYRYSAAAGPGQAATEVVPVSGRALAAPFAGSDYWLSDLGMEFLHWPSQRLVRDAVIKMRQGRSCKVLESLSPDPAATGCARVLAWLDAESGAPIYAEAFDSSGTRLKIYSLRGFKKVNGHWQPKEMEMLNAREDSLTRLEFSAELGE